LRWAGGRASVPHRVKPDTRSGRFGARRHRADSVSQVAGEAGRPSSKNSKPCLERDKVADANVVATQANLRVNEADIHWPETLPSFQEVAAPFSARRPAE
jgi:hypothetical protein